MTKKSLTQKMYEFLDWTYPFEDKVEDEVVEVPVEQKEEKA